ncbi:hypothetical protein MRX96_007155 [Rhipicephalus microplus]
MHSHVGQCNGVVLADRSGDVSRVGALIAPNADGGPSPVADVNKQASASNPEKSWRAALCPAIIGGRPRKATHN